ncbi:hypothetical protein AALP_AA4G242700 [Arabis alpina]|uniref:Uncharacterized protein n=1 Tax=Arabis alpina TaxID=50452 RepID=A0A087H5C8_ARAAL|nr:hypothetical protein AALP_AA4G242700 [Arabis alpina]
MIRHCRNRFVVAGEGTSRRRRRRIDSPSLTIFNQTSPYGQC